jgi:hypothetical protein
MRQPARTPASCNPPGPRHAALTVALLLAVFALFLVLTGPASAAPPESTMTLASLQQLLSGSPNGILDGSFNTAVKGATIATDSDVEAQVGRLHDRRPVHGQ